MPFNPLPTILTADLNLLSHRIDCCGLDLGCGDGALGQRLRRAEVPIWEIDKVAGSGGTFPDIVADVRSLPILSGRADLLVAANLVRHLLPQDPGADFLGSWFRTLRRDGVIYILEDLPDCGTPARCNYFDLQAQMALIVGVGRGGLLSPDDFVGLTRGVLPEASIQWGVCPNQRQPDPLVVLEFLAGQGGRPTGKIRKLMSSIQRHGLDYGDYWWLRIARERS